MGDTDERVYPLSEWVKPKQKKSAVWLHLLQNSKNANLLKCKHCDTTFRVHQTTTSYIYHMEHKHSILNLKSLPSGPSGSNNTASNNNASQSITSYFQKSSNSSPGLILAKLTALDRISFSTLANSEEIKNGWKAQGLKMPLTRKGIRSTVLEFANEIRESLKSDLKKKIEIGERFSLSLDEWTSKRNRRYMCINIHMLDENVSSLGMVRINSTMPATKAIEIVEKKLKQFDLVLKQHIITVVTDGASVMKKMGRMMGIYHQICHSHGIHLAVADVLYINKNMAEELDCDLVDDEDSNFLGFENIENDEQLVQNKLEEYELDSESDEENDYAETDLNSWQESVPTSNIIELVPNFLIIINKIRKIVRIFRKSPVKNDLLQRTIKTKLGKELTLIIDMRTRWNSMLAMLKRFLELKDVVKSVLTELSAMEFYPSPNEIKVITEIVESLEVIEVSSMALGKRDCNLAKALRIFEFLLSKLKAQVGIIGQNFYKAVSRRITERRCPNLEGLLEYLEEPNLYLSNLTQKDPILQRPTRNQLAETIKDIVQRLCLVEKKPNAAEIENQNDDELIKSTGFQSKADELNQFILKKAQVPTSNAFENSLRTIKNEMAIFEQIKERTNLLDKIYKALMSIPPSSIEAERCFSAAGLFITKLRTSLDDNSIDSLCFLRSHLLNEIRKHD